eukprot:CAMPEP_0113723604 /NCGR_PEP_ID=MMETSP0038_2-20120614/38531_1 /TAXON_ID=2898 /ORGANISM="Cryptomonas paramecium" /LENGTH=224 /DNA_ID=CAMNT_0000653243 /DNA_START=160 /DNA_END=830 /DNA_ORIENTATION=+ /assembly_acc=CAM_ASM_000170
MIDHYRRVNDGKLRSSVFLLSLCSPVLYKLLCGQFKETESREACIEEMSREAFEGALRLWLGEAVSVSSVDELVEIGRAADRFGMLRVCEAVQDAICAQLNKDWRVCVDTLNCCDGSALEKAAAHARKIAVDCFDALCASERLCELSAKELCALLDNDELCVDKEEEVLELVARWCNVRGDGGDDGVRLVGMVRFGVMGRDYLEGRACGLFRGAVREAVEARVR